MRSLAAALADSDADIGAALERVGFPAYVTDDQGRVRGLNAAALELVGDVRGRFAASVVAPGDQAKVQSTIARKLLGSLEASEMVVSVMTPAGELRKIDVSSTALRSSGRIVGVFGLFYPIDIPPLREDPHRRLTPRQHEVLAHLAAGCSTEQMAEKMGLSPATIRNHVKRLFKALGVHSRIEAVAVARRDRLVES
ncbi:MAG: LuxR C-terminal-related transcriptional regulator [Gaiellaceae bacterium]